MNPDNRIVHIPDNSPTGVWALIDGGEIVAVYDEELYALRALNAQWGSLVMWLSFGVTIQDALSSDRKSTEEQSIPVPVRTEVPAWGGDEAEPELGSSDGGDR